MVWLVKATSSVDPSGGDFATASAARLPPAPGRFSTITGRPSDAESGGAIARATVSVVPPGEAPTRSLIDLPEGSCARTACAAGNMLAARKPIAATNCAGAMAAVPCPTHINPRRSTGSHARLVDMRSPVRPHVGADHSASRADHAPT